MNKTEITEEKKTPGSLRIGLTTIVHTKEAGDLFYGYKIDDNTRIVGIKEFAKRIRGIYLAAKKDDPYADYFLLNVEKAFDAANAQLDQMVKTLEEIRENCGVKLSYASVDPVALDTSFSTVYGNLAMQLLIKADKLFLLIHALSHIGKLTRNKKQVLLNGNNNQKGVKQIIRRALLSQSGYIYTNLNRKDMELVTALTATAFAKMEKSLKLNGDNKLPECIIDRTCRGKHAPNISIDMNQLLFKSKKPPPPKTPSKEDNNEQ